MWRRKSSGGGKVVEPHAEIGLPPWSPRSDSETVPGALASQVSRTAWRRRGMEMCGWRLHAAVVSCHWTVASPLPSPPKVSHSFRLGRSPYPVCPPRPPAGTVVNRRSSPVTSPIDVPFYKMWPSCPSRPNRALLALCFSHRRLLTIFCS